MILEVKIAEPQSFVKDEWISMWPYYLDGARPLPEKKELDITFDRLLNPDTEPSAFFAYDAKTNKLLGFCHYVVHSTTKTSKMRCYLEDAYVLPEFRRRGIFKKLYAALLDKCTEQNWERIFWITRPDNEIAQSFYDQVALRTNWVRYEYEVKQ